MIPKFPEFKKLELSDQKEIEAITSKYPPYSDFDFATMWSWDIYSDHLISILDESLVVIFSDYLTGENYISFIGSGILDYTLDSIINFSKNYDTYLPVRLVPEICLRGLDWKNYLIEIDLNNYDYIYKTEELALYLGHKFGGKRKLYNRFLRNYNPRIEIMDKTENSKNQILILSKEWKKDKDEDYQLSLDKEFLALEKFLNLKNENTIWIGLYVGNILVGFQLFTVNNYIHTISQFGKTNKRYLGSFEYMMSESSKILLGRGVRYMNTQEDLGNTMLRFTKNSYNPSNLLRKYNIKSMI